MMNWPKSLVTEIARRRCILFLGAGVAASAQNATGNRPMEWKAFLTSAADLVHNTETQNEVKALINQNRMLLALQVINDEADPGDYRALLDRCFNDPSFEPSELHGLIFSLDSRLVITTNFDKIYEKHCLKVSTEGFKVIPYYSNSLVDEIKSDTRLIIKAHGSIDDIANMVFTKSEYYSAKARHSSFYTVLKALLLTNTCVFIGCSMDDPDVLLVLEELKMTANASRPHYALVRSQSQSVFVRKDLQSTYNVKTLEYGPNHDDLVTAMKDLQEQIDAIRSIG